VQDDAIWMISRPCNLLRAWIRVFGFSCILCCTPAQMYLWTDLNNLPWGWTSIFAESRQRVLKSFQA
jgi:hypothetical protein